MHSVFMEFSNQVPCFLFSPSGREERGERDEKVEVEAAVVADLELHEDDMEELEPSPSR